MFSGSDEREMGKLSVLMLYTVLEKSYSLSVVIDLL